MLSEQFVDLCQATPSQPQRLSPMWKLQAGQHSLPDDAQLSSASSQSMIVFFPTNISVLVDPMAVRSG
jgi:hypothetical protein